MQTAVSKGEFAQIIGVSAGRISQYLTEGKITAAALVGTGRNAKINIERARADLRLTLDVSQRLGNGIATRLDPDPSASAPIGAPGTGSAGNTIDPELPRGTDHEIKIQKLEQLRRANRNAAVAEARDSGLLMDTAAARAEMGRLASAMLDVFEGGINDMAMAVAAKFQLPQRDIKHLLRSAFRQVRETAAKQARDKGIDLPDQTQIILEGEEADQAAVS